MITGLRRSAPLALGAVLLLAGTGAGAEQGTPALRRAVMQFYAALNLLQAGDAGAMATLWSRRPDVTYMGPDGNFRHGWIEVDADLAAQAARKPGGSVEPRDITITVGRDLAVVANVEGRRRMVNGAVRTDDGRATSVFRLEAGAWKLIAHHVDPDPARAP